MEKQEIINEFLKKNFLVSPDIFNLENFQILEFLKEKLEIKTTVINKDILLNSFEQEFDWVVFENSRVLLEKGRNQEDYFQIIKSLTRSEVVLKEADQIMKTNFKVISNFTRVVDKKIVIQDFVEYFKSRYRSIREILLKRPELQDVISISKALNKKDKDNVTIIGLVANKVLTKNDNFIFEIEDLTGIIKVIVGKKDKELYDTCKEIMLDETLGVIGSFSKGILFGRRMIFPDIPLTKELKKCSDDVYLICTSDIHVGSRLFHRKEFLKFIEWVNGNFGDEKQVEIAKKVKYILIPGDLVAGVGVYPGQDKELEIKDIYDQYKELANLLSKIRKDIKIILCPGDHDAVMVYEPQPILDKDFSKPLYELENIYLVNNPSLVNIHSSEDFEGFNCLIYHGHSFIYYADNVEHIRGNGWTARGDLIMKYLLQRRHLSPTHSATLYLPEAKSDPLIIDTVPDFFISGHLHQVSNLLYRNVSLVGCGCWEGLTPYQQKTGNKADPCKVTLINLKNREVKILNFLKSEEEVLEAF